MIIADTNWQDYMKNFSSLGQTQLQSALSGIGVQQDKQLRQVRRNPAMARAWGNPSVSAGLTAGINENALNAANAAGGQVAGEEAQRKYQTDTQAAQNAWQLNSYMPAYTAEQMKLLQYQNNMNKPSWYDYLLQGLGSGAQVAGAFGK